jgi:hypothetical protein
MSWDPLLIARLRDLADRGASVRRLVCEIRGHFPDVDEITLEVDRYLTKAFFLPLREVRNVEASSCMGGAAFSDEQIDHLLLSLIASTRHLWAGPGEAEKPAANAMIGQGGPDPDVMSPGSLPRSPAAPEG